MPVKAFLDEKARRTDEALDAYLATWERAPAALAEAIRYSLFAGGKRLRPALALGAAELVSGHDAVALPAACALEMIHTYSLIHDDLPSMDDDDLRRGQPTCHKKYGEAMAILAGDGLLTMAFDVLAQADNAAVVGEIARAAGVGGMVGGQVADLQSEGAGIGLETLKDIHRRKTGALICAAVRSGALLAGVQAPALADLTVFGEGVGLAFQIVDDILDVTGDPETLGKPIGSDSARGKPTYASLVGIKEAGRLAEEAVASAIDALAGFGKEADTFRALAHYIVEREY